MRPRYRPRYGRPASRACGNARAWPGQGACHDTNFVSWLGAAFVSLMAAIQAATRSRVHHDTALGATILAAQRAGARTAQSTRAPGDTAKEGLRHGRCWATIRIHCAPRYGAVRFAWA